MYIVRGVLRGETRKDADLNIVFIADGRMIRMNSTFLKHRNTTDVLSFPLSGTNSRTIEGEIYVNLDQAQRQAKEYRVSIRNETARLVIHGVLHLVGYDDRSKRAKARMTRLEDNYLMKYFEG